jgi:hypothetical protein
MTRNRKVVFDIEANGLLPEVTQFWVGAAVDISTKEEFAFTDPWKFLEFLDSCSVLIGHNILMYDVLVLEKLFGWKPKRHHKLVDTMIMSQVQDYKRFGFGHSLAKWGDFLGFPKVEHEDWTQFSPEMLYRCVVDVQLNLKVYEYLLKELKGRKQTELLSLGLKAEHGMSRFVGRSVLHGWPFDTAKAKEVLARLETEMDEIKSFIEPMLKLRVKALDKDPEWKEPSWVRNGDYAVRTAKWFGCDPKEGQEDASRPVQGAYCRVEVVEPDIGSMEAVKDLLYELGWEPDEWNYTKGPKGQLVKTTPKLTEASLEPLGKVGEGVNNFYTLRARHSIITGWVEGVKDGRLHGDCFVIGTPTGRSRHEVIANIPKASSPWGPEMRSMFTAPPGYVMVGADSKGNQNRALAYYLNNPDYTAAIIAGDIHSFNQRILESILGPMGGDARDKAKRFFYALIFAGGAGKLALITTGKRDAGVGQRIKDEFLRRIPGLSELVTRLERQFNGSLSKTGKGYIIALDGRPIYAEAARLVLNYALQSFEKVTVAAAVDQLQTALDEGGFDWQPLIVYHDECQFYVREDQAEAAKELALAAFRDAPKQFGVTIMEGDANIGANWYETH